MQVLIFVSTSHLIVIFVCICLLSPTQTILDSHVCHLFRIFFGNYFYDFIFKKKFSDYKWEKCYFSLSLSDYYFLWKMLFLFEFIRASKQSCFCDMNIHYNFMVCIYFIRKIEKLSTKIGLYLAIVAIRILIY